MFSSVYWFIFFEIGGKDMIEKVNMRRKGGKGRRAVGRKGRRAEGRKGGRVERGERG